MKRAFAAAALFALLFALAASAPARETPRAATDAASLAAAISSAAPGEDIVLAAGVYEPAGGILSIDKPVNLIGAPGDGECVFRGGIVFDLGGTSAGSSVRLANINFAAAPGVECAVALASGQGRTLELYRCGFDGVLYGAAIYPGCGSCRIDAEECLFNTFCGLAAPSSGANSANLAACSAELYASCVYGEGAALYGEGGGQPLEIDGELAACWPARARIGGRFFTSLAEAARSAARGDTVYALGGEDGSGEVHVAGGVTLDIAQGAQLYCDIVNGGKIINRGVIHGSVSGGEVLTLMRAVPDDERISVAVRDRSGRVYQPEAGTRDYYLAPGSYTFEFGGEGWYTAETGVAVSAERSDIVQVHVDPMLSFADVRGSDWFYSDVYAVFSKGLMDGVSGSEFSPGGSVTRAMAAAVIYRLAGSPEAAGAGTPAFADVDAAAWYAPAVLWAAGNGIIDGVAEGAFAPGEGVTREALAAMLYRYAQFSGREAAPGALAFPDAAEISPWAEEAFAWAAGEGIISGSDGGRAAPREGVTRAQLAAMLNRYGG